MGFFHSATLSTPSLAGAGCDHSLIWWTATPCRMGGHRHDPTPPTASMQVDSHQRDTPARRPPHHPLVQGVPLAHLVDSTAMQDGWTPTTIRHHQRHPCRWTPTKDSTSKKAIQHHSKATPSLAGAGCGHSLIWWTATPCRMGGHRHDPTPPTASMQVDSHQRDTPARRPPHHSQQ